MNRKIFSILTTLVVISIQAVLAQPDTLWTKTYGGSDYDYGSSVQQTSDGGYIIVGETRSYAPGTYDLWLLKTDAAGDIVWTKTFGGSDKEFSTFVQQTSDGGYIITGRTNSYGAGSYDLWLIKTDESGVAVWTKTFGGSGWDGGNSVQQTSDGGYILTGQTDSFGAGSKDLWLLKTDASGDTVWTKTFGGSGYDGGNSVQQTSDGGYILTGSTESYGAVVRDLWLVKTDASGDTVWTNTFGGSEFDHGSSVQQTSDGGYILTGGTNFWDASSWGGTPPDAWLIKTDELGDAIWSKTFGGSGDDGGSSVQQTSDGGYIVMGSTNSYGAGFSDVWLIKTDASGDTVWTETFGGSGDDDGFDMQPTSDGGYILVGSTDSYGAGETDAWLIRLALDTTVIAIGNAPSSIPTSFSVYQNYPNPFNPITTLEYDLPEQAHVTLTIYDILGRRARTLVDGVKPSGFHKALWDGANDLGQPVSTGVYLYRIQADQFVQTRKMILIR